MSYKTNTRKQLRSGIFSVLEEVKYESEGEKLRHSKVPYNSLSPWQASVLSDVQTMNFPEYLYSPPTS